MDPFLAKNGRDRPNYEIRFIQWRLQDLQASRTVGWPLLNKGGRPPHPSPQMNAQSVYGAAMGGR